MTADEAIARLAETGVSTQEMTEALYVGGYLEPAPLSASGWTWTDRGLARYREVKAAK